jgi:sugar phosphate isomerase/epimerase
LNPGNLLAFSTLACPEWPAETVIEKAAAFGYDALEWRGGAAGHVPPGLSAQRLAGLRRLQDAAGLRALAVTAYTSFVSDEMSAREATFVHLRQHCDTAAALGAAYVRAFLNENEPVNQAPALYYDRLAEALLRAAGYAASVGVCVAVEPHDEFIHSSTVAAILALAPHPALGVIWDVGNTYAAGEVLDDGLCRLRSRLCYVQVKDGRGRGAHWTLAPLGAGEVPLPDALRRLRAGGYTGAFSVEWERAWHPELAPAEFALPLALKQLRAWLA